MTQLLLGLGDSPGRSAGRWSPTASSAVPSLIERAAVELRPGIEARPSRPARSGTRQVAGSALAPAGPRRKRIVRKIATRKSPRRSRRQGGNDKDPGSTTDPGRNDRQRQLRSATLRASGPITEMSAGLVFVPRQWPSRANSMVGLWPNTPQKCAGLRIDHRCRCRSPDRSSPQRARPPTRPTSRPACARVPRIVRPAVDVVVALEVDEPRRHVGLAEDIGAGGQQPMDGQGVAVARLSLNSARPPSWSRSTRKTLYRHRHAVQRPGGDCGRRESASRARSRARSKSLTTTATRRGIEPYDPLDEVIEKLQTSDLAVAHKLRQLDRVLSRTRGHEGAFLTREYWTRKRRRPKHPAGLAGPRWLVMTLPIVVPLIIAAGYDKVWFGASWSSSSRWLRLRPQLA